MRSRGGVRPICVGGVGVGLWIAEAAGISEPLFYGLSNALLFVACATIWNGARLFYGRKVRPYALAAGAIVWIVACQIPSFAQSDIYRIVLSSLIVSLYTFATAREIWSDRRKRTRSPLGGDTYARPAWSGLSSADTVSGRADRRDNFAIERMDGSFHA